MSKASPDKEPSKIFKGVVLEDYRTENMPYRVVVEIDNLTPKDISAALRSFDTLLDSKADPIEQHAIVPHKDDTYLQLVSGDSTQKKQYGFGEGKSRDTRMDATFITPAASGRILANTKYVVFTFNPKDPNQTDQSVVKIIEMLSKLSIKKGSGGATCRLNIQDIQASTTEQEIALCTDIKSKLLKSSSFVGQIKNIATTKPELDRKRVMIAERKIRLAAEQAKAEAEAKARAEADRIAAIAAEEAKIAAAAAAKAAEIAARQEMIAAAMLKQQAQEAARVAAEQTKREAEERRRILLDSISKSQMTKEEITAAALAQQAALQEPYAHQLDRVLKTADRAAAVRQGNSSDTRRVSFKDARNGLIEGHEIAHNATADYETAPIGHKLTPEEIAGILQRKIAKESAREAGAAAVQSLREPQPTTLVNTAAADAGAALMTAGATVVPPDMSTPHSPTPTPDSRSADSRTAATGKG